MSQGWDFVLAEELWQQMQDQLSTYLFVLHLVTSKLTGFIKKNTKNPSCILPY